MEAAALLEIQRWCGGQTRQFVDEMPWGVHLGTNGLALAATIGDAAIRVLTGMTSAGTPLPYHAIVVSLPGQALESDARLARAAIGQTQKPRLRGFWRPADVAAFTAECGTAVCPHFYARIGAPFAPLSAWCCRPATGYRAFCYERVLFAVAASQHFDASSAMVALDLLLRARRLIWLQDTDEDAARESGHVRPLLLLAGVVGALILLIVVARLVARLL
jgi:hypothetical protein